MVKTVRKLVRWILGFVPGEETERRKAKKKHSDKIENCKKRQDKLLADNEAACKSVLLNATRGQ